jgi:hypothetical protein
MAQANGIRLGLTFRPGAASELVGCHRGHVIDEVDCNLGQDCHLATRFEVALVCHSCGSRLSYSL